MVSALGLLVTLFLGLVGWRLQLIGKRRTEVAEEALVVLSQAVDALDAIRNPWSSTGEHEAVRREAGKAGNEQLVGDGYHVVLWRIRQPHERLFGLRRVQLLCRYHFRRVADEAFEEFQRAVRRVRASAATLAMAEQPGEEFTPEDLQLRRQWRRDIWKSMAPDEITDSIAAAQQRLEAVLAPHLRADAALLPVAVGWQAGRAWLASWVRTIGRGGSSTRPSEPDVGLTGTGRTRRRRRA